MRPSAGRPGTGEPARAERPRRRDPRWARALVIFGAVLMVLAGGAIVAKAALFSYATKSVSQENLLGSAGKEAQQKGHVAITGAKNILLVGVDERPDKPATERSGADSILVLHIPAAHDAAYLVSIPRDTLVREPATGTGRREQRDKITNVYGNAGTGLAGREKREKSVERLALTIGLNWGIKFDGAAIVNFTGFQQVVEVLGGVDMYVDQDTKSVHIGHDRNGKVKVPYEQCNGNCLNPVPGVTPVVYRKGDQHLEPWQALDYVRQRELLENGDYDRQRHQQQFIKALFKGMISRDVLSNPVKFNKVVDVVGRAMTIDDGGIDLTDWAFAMRAIGGDDLVTVKTNNGGFNPSPDYQGAEQLDQITLDLLDSVKNEQVGQFLAAHPELVVAERP